MRGKYGQKSTFYAFIPLLLPLNVGENPHAIVYDCTCCSVMTMPHTCFFCEGLHLLLFVNNVPVINKTKVAKVSTTRSLHFLSVILHSKFALDFAELKS